MDPNYQELLENLMHELAQININSKASSEAISKAVKGNLDRKALIHHSEILLENAFLFSTHLDVVTHQLNPDYFLEEKADKRNLFGKFFKAIIPYKRRAKQRDVEINVTGNAQTLIDLYPVIDTLPILILDNAVKYSAHGCEIEIEFYEDEHIMEVSVSNLGPYLRAEELKHIFERGYRGTEALKTKVIGRGYGMNFIKHICDLHKAIVEVTSSEDFTKINEIKYSMFRIKIEFSKEPLN
ncbi:MAG: hypothetical protein POELPBGB_00239 [Bacteroidia bacterium]|nr:hypothetical protein [Bacteroidia bacterium]